MDLTRVPALRIVVWGGGQERSELGPVFATHAKACWFLFHFDFHFNFEAASFSFLRLFLIFLDFKSGALLLTSTASGRRG